MDGSGGRSLVLILIGNTPVMDRIDGDGMGDSGVVALTAFVHSLLLYGPFTDGQWSGEG